MSSGGGGVSQWPRSRNILLVYGQDLLYIGGVDHHSDKRSDTMTTTTSDMITVPIDQLRSMCQGDCMDPKVALASEEMLAETVEYFYGRLSVTVTDRLGDLIYSNATPSR